MMTLLIILLTPVLVLVGTWLAFQVGWWMLKRSLNKFDKWLDSP